MYGENQIPMTSLSHYAVGKIEGSQIDNSIKELTVNTSTAEGQSLKIFCHRLPEAGTCMEH